MGKEALQIGANTFQFFTRNPRGSKAKKIDLQDIAAFQRLAASHQFGTILAHAPYTINPCSGEERTREFAFETMTDDLQRLEYTPGVYYNFHPGSHVGQGAQAGIDMIASDKQVGGDHYRNCAIQPVEYIEANALKFLEGCVVKRVTRHDKPTGKGRQDIEKAIHELQLLLQHPFPMHSE